MQAISDWLNWLIPEPGTFTEKLSYGLVVAVIFNIFFAGIAKKLRRWLSQKSGNWFRRCLRYIYVRIFVGAVQGKSRLAAAYTNIYILLICSFLLFTSGFQDTLLPAFKSLSTQELFQELREIRDLNENRLADESRVVSGSHDIAIEDIGDDLKAITIGGTATSLELWLAYAKVIAGLCLGLWVMIRLPFARYRSQFAYELERFTGRIQGLATREELAELIEKEIAVKDEKTAEEFVESMAKIARRRNVGSLVDTFLLWGSVKFDA